MVRHVRHVRRAALAVAATTIAMLPVLPAAGESASGWVEASVTVDQLIPEGDTSLVSQITVAEEGWVVENIWVAVSLRHGDANDLDVLLVGPQGQSVMLLSDAGCNAWIEGLISFDDVSPPAPQLEALSSDHVRPTNYDDANCSGLVDDILPGAPPGPWGDRLSVFRGTDPKGTWTLYVHDDTPYGGVGHLDWWHLDIRLTRTAPSAPPFETAFVRTGWNFAARLPEPSGIPTPVYSVDPDSLPPGVTFDGQYFMGRIDEAGIYEIEVTLSNGAPPDVVRPFVIVVGSPPVVTSAGEATAYVGVPFRHQLTATGFPEPEWSLSGDLPRGLSLQGDAIVGTPEEEGAFPVTLTAANGLPPAATKSFLLTVRTLRDGPSITLAPEQGAVTRTQPVRFTLTFPQEPSGFAAEDLVLDGTAAGGAVTLTGGPLVWTASVSGLASDGTVRLSLPDAAWQDAEDHRGRGAVGPAVLLDTRAPVLHGPQGTLTVRNDPGRPGAVVHFSVTVQESAAPAARAATPAARAAAAEAVACAPASGSFFPLGTTRVECSATDEAGNTGTLTFAVTVEDVEAPVIEQVEDVEVDLPTGEQEVAVDFELPAASDNSGQVEVGCDARPGDRFTAGERQVRCTAEDPSGNTATTSFTVTVRAAEDPHEHPDEAADEAPDEVADEAAGEDGLAATGVAPGVPAWTAVLLVGLGAVLTARGRVARRGSS